MSSQQAIALDTPLVASPNQTMKALLIGREKFYELIAAGELESYTEGRSRRVTVSSIEAYLKRRLAAEAQRRGRAGHPTTTTPPTNAA
jgi:excisionase family DNA binding protein